MEFIAAAVSIFSQIGNTALFVMFVTKPDTAPNVDRIRFTAVTSSFVRFRNKGRVWLHSVKFLKKHLSIFEVLNIDYSQK